MTRILGILAIGTVAQLLADALATSLGMGSWSYALSIPVCAAVTFLLMQAWAREQIVSMED